MKYRKTVNVYDPQQKCWDTMQVGQWVSAGEPDERRNNCGQFYGMRPNGTVIVAWNGNARNSGGWRHYHASLRQYAKAK